MENHQYPQDDSHGQYQQDIPYQMQQQQQQNQSQYPMNINTQQMQAHSQHGQYPQALQQQNMGQPPPGYIDPRTPNGRLRYEAMQEAQAGYGSDGSETLSVNSAQSMQNR